VCESSSSSSEQSQYEKYKEVNTAQGVKILGKDLEKTLAGLPLLVAYQEDEIPVLRVTHTHTLTDTHTDTHTHSPPPLCRMSWCGSSNRR